MLPFLDTTQEQLIQKIEFASGQISNKQITKNILYLWRNPPQSYVIKAMQEAHEYYKVNNTEIDHKSRDYYDDCGRRIENPTLSNIKLKSGYLRLSIEQKMNYAFAKPFILEIMHKENEEETEELLLYKSYWEKFLDDDNRETLVRASHDGANKGIGWVYPYIDEKEQLQILDEEPEILYPSWADTRHRILDAMVRDYKIIQYNYDTLEEIQKVEYWDDEIVERYIEFGDNEVLVDDVEYRIQNEIPDAQGDYHILLRGQGIGWGKVPFIAIKGNQDELPLLSIIRSWIDAYDKVASNSADTIQDNINAILLLKGISAELGDLIQARKVVLNSRIATVDAEGDAKFITSDTDIQSVLSELEFLDKNIMKFSNTVDLDGTKVGNSSSEVALKAMYQILDIYCNGLEKQFRTAVGSSISGLKYFFDKWLELKGIGTMEVWDNYRVHVTLDRDMLINEAELINNLATLSGVVSQETLDNYNPVVIDHKTEQARRDKEREEQKANDEQTILKDQLLKDAMAKLELGDESEEETVE